VLKAGIGATKLAYKGTKVGIGATKLAHKGTKAIAKKVLAHKAEKVAAKKVVKKAIVKKVKRGAIKTMLNIIKKKLILKLGIKGASKLLAKIASRFVPFVGWGLLAYDAYHVAKYMYEGMPFKSAVSKAVLGFDIFDDNSVPVDDNGTPIKPDIPKKAVKKELNKMHVTGTDIKHKKALDKINRHINIKNNISPVNNKDYTKTINNLMYGKDNAVNRKDYKQLNTKPITTDDILNEIKVDKGFDKKKLLTDLVRDEGIRTRVYRDSLGYKTIGIGHLLDKRKGGEPLRNILGVDKNTITVPEAYKVLAHDVNKTAKQLYSKLPWLKTKPEPVQRDLINMGFNLGTNGLLNFRRTLNDIKYDKYTEAARDMLQSKWAKQVGPRAERIAMEIASTPKETIAKEVNTNRNAIMSNFNINNKPLDKYINASTTKKEIPINVTPPTVHVETKETHTKEELSKMHDTHKESKNILAKSYEVHIDSNKKLGELVELNKAILSALGGNNKNKKRYNNHTVPASTPVMDHKVSSF